MLLNVFLSRRAAIAVVASLLMVSGAFRHAAANSIVPSYIYGIDDQNDIWQVDPIPGQQSAESTFSTGLSGNPNAVAFDRGRDQLFFLGGLNVNETNDLYMWNKPLGSGPGAFQLITTSGNLGISSTAVYNAAYYNDAFWFFKEGTNQLVKASLSYSGTSVGTVPTFSSTTTYTVAGAPNDSTNGFGDIAINADTGMLYAATSSGLFYSVNLLTDPAAGYSSIKAGGNISLQISFNEDYSVLYGHNYNTAAWYTVDVRTGDVTDLGFATPANGVSGVGFRDLGGASAIDVTPVPEIDLGSFGSAIALLLSALGLLERRSLRRLAGLAHG